MGREVMTDSRGVRRLVGSLKQATLIGGMQMHHATLIGSMLWWRDSCRLFSCEDLFRETVV